MADITISQLHKYFGDKHILKDITFDILSGEKVAIVGPNGAGKTTLFKIITSEIPYDSGSFSIAKDKTIGIIDQMPCFDEKMTVEDILNTAFHRLDDIKNQIKSLEKQMVTDNSEILLKKYGELSSRFEMMDGYNITSRINKVCNGLEIPDFQRNQLFSSLSGGEKTRVNLARIILEDTDILLLDEPTNHLDIGAVNWLGTFLENYKGTVVMISHDRYFLDQCCERIIEISDGVCDFYEGSYSYYAVEHERRYEQRLFEYESQIRKVRDLTERSTEMHQWGTEKMHKRAASIDKRIAKMKVCDRPKKEHKLSLTFGDPNFETEELIFVKNITKEYNGKKILSDISFTVRNGDKIAILGDNGTGKTTLLKIILGTELADSGKIKKADGLKHSYLPQQVVFEHPERNLIDTLIYDKNLTMQTSRNRLGSFKFSGETQFKTVSTLSGGEKSRLKLCSIMYDPLNMLILDEPTNHLDIISREWIEEAVEAFQGTLLFVSHDRYFISRFANRIITIKDGEIIDFSGNYEQYLAFLESTTTNNKPKPLKIKKEKPKIKGGTKNISKQISSLEREIASLEEKLSKNESDIALFVSNADKLTELLNEKNKLDDDLLTAMGKWEELSLLLDYEKD